MDWAIIIFLVVTGATAGSLWWWASEVEKAGQHYDPRRITTASPTTTPRDKNRDAF